MKRRVFFVAAALVAAATALPLPAKPRQPMSDGERLYRANCAACHRLIAPTRHSDEEWAALVAKYGGRLKLKDADQGRILEYLTNAN